VGRWRLRSVLAVLAVAGLVGCSTGSSSGPASSGDQGLLPPAKNLADLLAQSRDVPTTYDETWALITHAGDVTVKVPVDLKRGVRLTVGDQQVATITPDATGSQPRIVAPGVALFANTATSTNSLIQVLGENGLRFLVTLKQADAPSEFSYKLGLPAGATGQIEGQGVSFSLAGKQLFAVPPPFAVDAAGRHLDAFYSLSGDTLSLHINHAGATFPVVADPLIDLAKAVLKGLSGAGVQQIINDFVIQPITCGTIGLDCPDEALAPGDNDIPPAQRPAGNRSSAPPPGQGAPPAAGKTEGSVPAGAAQPPSVAQPAPAQQPPAAVDRKMITSYNRIQPGAPYHGYFDSTFQAFTAQSNTITYLAATVGTQGGPAGQALGASLLLKLCGDSSCSSVLGQGQASIVNYGESGVDIGDVAVTPGATYYVVWYQPPAFNGQTWVTYWWGGGSSIESSDQLQAAVRGYNR